MTAELIQDSPVAAMPCSAAAATGTGFKTVQLAPWGTVQSTNGTFIVDDEGTRELIAEFEKHGAALPIDLEHESLPGKSPATGSRGAVGWIEKVFAEAGLGLFALVKWADKGRQAIQSDAFRYVSPVFWNRKDDRRAVGLHSAALTTTPAIPQGNMERLAASASTEQQMDAEALKEIGTLLVLNSATPLTLSAVQTALVKRLDLSKRDGEVAAAVRERLKLGADAGKDEVILALSVSESTELQSMKQAESERVAVELVEVYCQKNVLNKNDKAAYAAALSLAKESPDRLHALLANAKPLAPLEMSRSPSNTARDQVFRGAMMEFRSNAAHGKGWPK